MLKLIAILTSCSLALAVSVQAAEKPDQPDAKKPAAKPKNVPKQQAAPKQQPAAPKTQVQTAPKTPKKQERTVPAVQSEKPANVESKKVQKDKSPLETTKKSTVPTGPAPATKATTTTNAPAANLTTSKAKVDPEAVKKIRAQHANFKAKPNTAIASAQFNPNYRIEAAQNWSGPQYEVFRSYQPQWHDQTWYRSRYSNNLLLIGGGWYFWDAGYWYPAWGYDDAAAYYPYDGPIYVGSNARPFDQVVADVQAVLQEQGFYKGEVDGLVGPLTREALTAYQSAQGLPPTAAIDQPTLDSLGLS